MGNHGTVVGADYTNDGIVGKALDFNGADIVRVPNSASLNITDALTIETWINPNNWGIGENPLNNNLYRIYHRGAWAGDRIYFLYKIAEAAWPGDSAWSGWAGVRTSTQLVTDKWHHIVGTKSGNKMILYLDGKKERELNCLDGYTINNSSISDLIISQGNFDGTIDEVRIYNEAISSSQIRENYYAGLKRLLAKGGISGEEYEEKVKIQTISNYFKITQNPNNKF